jgi:membrane-bound serine protease (ClpP class)
VVEVIVPGFGLPGIGGIIFVFIGIVLAVDSVTTALLSLSIAVIVTSIVTVFLIKMGFRSKTIGKIVLNSNHTTERGYLSVDTKDIYLDKVGITQTELRPTGFIEIEGIRLDALAESGYIPKDIEIKVVKVEGSKIFVRRV